MEADDTEADATEADDTEAEATEAEATEADGMEVNAGGSRGRRIFEDCGGGGQRGGGCRQGDGRGG